MTDKPHIYRQQLGAVLLMCLIFMLLMTIISASALQSTILQERMAGNARDSNSAFQAAEAALRQAERTLQGALGTFNGSAGLYKVCSGAARECHPPDWADRSASNWASLTDLGGNVSSQPNYYIEELPDIAKQTVALDADQPTVVIKIYRITARGFGVSDNSMVVLRAIYRRE